MSASLRVGFNARMLHDPRIRGWNRYTLELIAALARRGVDLVLYSDKPVAREHLEALNLKPEQLQVREAPPMRYLAWEQRWLPRACAQDRVDILHSPFNFGLPWSSRCRRVLTLHDAIADAFRPANEVAPPPLDRAAVMSRLQEWVARTRAHKVITVSEHARLDLIRLYRIPGEKLAVTHEAADDRFRRPVPDSERAEVRGRHGLSGRYVFYVGGWEERKNIPFLVRAFAEAGLEGVELVLAGGRDEQRARLSALAESLGIGDRLRLLGWVEDSDLPALYSESLCFVYPSLYEGFGLQLCEAMACGCPTLASRATCLPEVLGDGGELFRLDSTEELVGHLRRVAEDSRFRDDLTRRGRLRSGEFSWDRTAEQTLSVYHAALDRT